MPSIIKIASVTEKADVTVVGLTTICGHLSRLQELILHLT